MKRAGVSGVLVGVPHVSGRGRGRGADGEDHDTDRNGGRGGRRHADRQDGQRRDPDVHATGGSGLHDRRQGGQVEPTLKPGTKLNATVKDDHHDHDRPNGRDPGGDGGVRGRSDGDPDACRPTSGSQYNIKSTDPVKFYDHERQGDHRVRSAQEHEDQGDQDHRGAARRAGPNIAVTGTAPTQAAAAAPAAAAPKPAAAAAPPAAARRPRRRRRPAPARNAEDAAQDGQPAAAARSDRFGVAGDGAGSHRRSRR